MKITNTRFKGLKKITGKNHIDNRGNFRELFRKDLLCKKNLIFWCTSKSKKNVIRGLHYQKKLKQDMFVSVLKGKIFDVALDVRKKSKTYGEHHSLILSQLNSKSMFIPSGFAHGFCGLEEENIVLYGISNFRSKKNEIGILWNDKNLKIKWPVKKAIISKKDKKNITFQAFKKN